MGSCPKFLHDYSQCQTPCSLILGLIHCHGLQKQKVKVTNSLSQPLPNILNSYLIYQNYKYIDPVFLRFRICIGSVYCTYIIFARCTTYIVFIRYYYFSRMLTSQVSVFIDSASHLSRSGPSESIIPVLDNVFCFIL